jgi:hypothetical protein
MGGAVSVDEPDRHRRRSGAADVARRVAAAACCQAWAAAALLVSSSAREHSAEASMASRCSLVAAASAASMLPASGAGSAACAGQAGGSRQARQRVGQLALDSGGELCGAGTRQGVQREGLAGSMGAARSRVQETGVSQGGTAGRHSRASGLLFYPCCVALQGPSAACLSRIPPPVGRGASAAEKRPRAGSAAARCRSGWHSGTARLCNAAACAAGAA